jgi:drug/metabolite transporter (DMT)-like permease
MLLAVLWLEERVTPRMAAGCAPIVAVMLIFTLWPAWA